MIEVTIDSIRVSLMSQHRVVVLKDVQEERYLPIWIGPFEADAITIQLQGVQVARPLTHDLLKSLITAMGAKVSHVLVNDLRNDTFYAQIVMDSDGRYLEIDSRPSDAIALAVRVNVPIFVAESVMEKASIIPDEEIGPTGISKEEEEKLSVYREFLDTLDIEGLNEPDEE
ncbi:MAG: bifunctional nuclease family protein [Anaerolineae bacterium]